MFVYTFLYIMSCHWCFYTLCMECKSVDSCFTQFDPGSWWLVSS